MVTLHKESTHIANYDNGIGYVRPVQFSRLTQKDPCALIKGESANLHLTNDTIGNDHCTI